MQLLKNHTHIYGFEDYNIVQVNDTCLYATWGFFLPYNFATDNGSYIINKNLPVKVEAHENPSYYWIKHIEFKPRLVENNRELLKTAQKVFVHPSCKISRSMMAEKYKKSLNPFLSDAVVIPNPEYGEFTFNQYALFINDLAKIVVMVCVETDEAQQTMNGASDGIKFKDLIRSNPDDGYGKRKQYKTEDVLDSELFYYGEVLFVPNSQSWAMDVLTHNLPVDKVVFEDSVQESLGNETNQLDFDSLCSIKDMLESTDENTVSAGLKSLSMMDWVHYPESIKFILNNVNSKSNWIYNKACNSTSVKYMMKIIAGDHARKRTWWPGNYDEEIYEADFELFKKLKCHYHHIQPDQIMNNIRSIEFITVSADGFITPNIKQRN